MSTSLPELPARHGIEPVADGHTNMLHHAVIAIAVDHAGGAAVPDALGAIEIEYMAQRPLPVVASVKIEVPIEVEKLPSGDADKLLRLGAQMALHVVDRGCRVEHLKDGVDGPNGIRVPEYGS